MKSQKLINIFLVFFVSIYTSTLFAQLELPYSSTIFYGTIINPAHSEKDSAVQLIFLNKDQWNGVQGAPKSQLVSGSIPMGSSSHIGGNIFRNTAGVSQRFTLDIFYNYKIRMEDAVLSLGLLASLQQERRDFTKEGLLFTDPIATDVLLEEGIISLSSFNTGVGLHYEKEKFNFGLSVPRLLNNRLGLFGSEKVLNNTPIFVYGNLYTTIRRGFILRNRLNLQFDANQYSLLQYFIGFNYRNNIETGVQLNSQITNGFDLHSVDILANIIIHRNFTLGLSYGIPLSPISQLTPGNFEVYINYLIPVK